MYLSEDEIFKDLMLYKLDEATKRYIKNTDEEDLIMFYGSYGHWIRNEYNMWSVGNPYVVQTDTGHRNYPDQISRRLINRIWTTLTGKKRTFEYQQVQDANGVWTMEKVPLGN